MSYIDDNEKQWLDFGSLSNRSYDDNQFALDVRPTQDAGERAFLGFLMHPMVKPSSSEEELFSAPPPSP
jgi:hypothetical protein